ncbi:MAG: hypothetical protein U1C74_18765 [Phenylobacterium sp.]|nr:hypothetical protein [Phenylobacterium sp.]
MRTALTLATATALTPGLAFAHAGHHEVLTLAQQIHHLTSQPDHLLGVAALGAMILAGGWTWARRRTSK